MRTIGTRTTPRAEYELEYRVVSESCISFQLAAAPNPHSFSPMQPLAACCSYPARTFNPTHVTDAGIEASEPNVHWEARLRSGSKRAANDL